MAVDMQIVSDIHLEYYPDSKYDEPTYNNIFKSIISPISENNILILAGDIGYVNDKMWKEFMKYVSSNWRLVLYVLGNHEYYSNSNNMQKLFDMYDDFLSQYRNIQLLCRKKITININSGDGCDNGQHDDEYEILGLTMWTKNDYASIMEINDFKRIKIRDLKTKYTIPITLSHYNELHERDRCWLLENINTDNKPRNKKTIIITHFPLIKEGTSHPKYYNQKQSIKNYYANDLHDDLVMMYKPTPHDQLIVISGHTHYNYDFVKDNIRYISNCYRIQ